jgi:hypothetical protein
MKNQKAQPTFGDLYRYLSDSVEKKEAAKPFHLVRRFSDRHAVDADALIPILEGFGGYDDMEVLFNVMDRIPPEIEIGSDVETAEKVAVREGFYCRWEDGQWTLCSADHPDATPDLNRALWLLMKHAERHV